MSTKGFLVGVIVLVLIAVIAGVLVIGSPNEARRQTFDDSRYRELVALAAGLTCTNDKISPVLPVELTTESLRSYCGGRDAQPPALVDDETNEPYKYARKSDAEFSICARFYDAARAARTSAGYQKAGWAFDPASGCVTGRIR